MGQARKSCPKSREIIPSSSEDEKNSPSKKRKTEPNTSDDLPNCSAKKSKNDSIVELKNCRIVEVTPEYENQRAKNIEEKKRFLQNSSIHTAKKSLSRPKKQVSKTAKPKQQVKERILPRRRASQKPQNSYAEDHEENSQDSVKFYGLPPALLAASPGLANATSGSLLVVESTNSEDAPISQVLEVFNEETGTGNERNIEFLT